MTKEMGPQLANKAMSPSLHPNTCLADCDTGPHVFHTAAWASVDMENMKSM